MKYPLLDKNSALSEPSPGKCLVCGANLRETGFVWLQGHCELRTKTGGFHKKWLHWSSYINFGFHGCHGAEHEGLLRKDRYVYLPIRLVEDFRCNSIELQFCSTICARKWFNELMDDLDAAVEEEIAKEEDDDEEE